MEGAPATGQTGSKRGGIDVNCQNTRIQELAFLKPTETTALFHPRFSSGYKTLRWTILQRRAPGPTPWGLGFGVWGLEVGLFERECVGWLLSIAECGSGSAGVVDGQAVPTNRGPSRTGYFVGVLVLAATDGLRSWLGAAWSDAGLRALCLAKLLIPCLRFKLWTYLVIIRTAPLTSLGSSGWLLL